MICINNFFNKFSTGRKALLVNFFVRSKKKYSEILKEITFNSPMKKVELKKLENSHDNISIRASSR